MADKTRQFEAAMLPHLNAAYNLARWLVRDDTHAQDIVQEAYLRAFKFFDSFRGGEARPWLLGIVRNTCFTWLREQAREKTHIDFDEMDDDARAPELSLVKDNPEIQLIRKLEQIEIVEALEKLPPVFREIIILRELEEMSYEEIAKIVAIPAGTVMSRLARGRAMLRAALSAHVRRVENE